MLDFMRQEGGKERKEDVSIGVNERKVFSSMG
jgi:hypothetical protein